MKTIKTFFGLLFMFFFGLVVLALVIAVLSIPVFGLVYLAGTIKDPLLQGIVMVLTMIVGLAEFFAFIGATIMSNRKEPQEEKKW